MVPDWSAVVLGDLVFTPGKYAMNAGKELHQAAARLLPDASFSALQHHPFNLGRQHFEVCRETLE
jgi:hypothetical protein